ncbi:MAG TPA: hypothetical protein VJL29_07795 [Thermoguttaceae bacterium]|nr:hypothetical protein [Thermoguttaceae bacterium]
MHKKSVGRRCGIEAESRDGASVDLDKAGLLDAVFGRRDPYQPRCGTGGIFPAFGQRGRAMNSRFRPSRFSWAWTAARWFSLDGPPREAADSTHEALDRRGRPALRRRTFRREGPHAALPPMCEMRPPPPSG